LGAIYALEIEKRRGRRIAIVALARKMAGILYALLRDGSRYDASRGRRCKSPTSLSTGES